MEWIIPVPIVVSRLAAILFFKNLHVWLSLSLLHTIELEQRFCFLFFVVNLFWMRGSSYFDGTPVA